MSLQDLFRSPQGQPASAGIPYSTYHINKVKLDVADASKKLAAREGKRDLLLQQRTDAEKSISAADTQLDTFDKVAILLQATSDYARQQVKGRIEELVSQALNIVYGGSHKFTIGLVVRAGRPEADYWLNENGVLTKLVRPTYNNGGGKVDIISLTLRLAIGELVGDQGPIFLDEVGKHVDGEAAVNLAYFLKQYAQKFDRQIILITHNTTLAEIGDVSYRVSKNADNEAVVKGVVE